MSKFQQVTPVMHVADLDGAVAFFTDILGFEALIHARDYAYLHRATVGFRIMKTEGPQGASHGNRRLAYYFDVVDVDALYAELKAKLDGLPPGDVHGPVDRPYGQREFLLPAPDGNLIGFGQAIGGAS